MVMLFSDLGTDVGDVEPDVVFFSAEINTGNWDDDPGISSSIRLLLSNTGSTSNEDCVDDVEQACTTQNSTRSVLGKKYFSRAAC